MRLKNNITWITSHGTFKVPWLTLLISLIVLVLFAMGPDKNSVFVFNKFEIKAGATWRLLTGQLIHNNFDHLFWDLFGFMVIGSIVEINGRWKFILSFMLSAISVSLWMFLLEKDFTVYYGLSGLLNGLLVIAVFVKWKETRNPLFVCIFGITALKMTYEVITKNVFFIDPNIPTIPGTHIAGFIVGILMVYFSKKNIYYSEVKK
ncbi:MAG: rhombosortase [Candidatus Omnitrophica bacterium]|nr:rhombosortase [Candidatus Omnitrophota bacterium]